MVRVYEPMGTVGVPTTSLIPFRRRSNTVLIPAGLEVGTTSTSLLVVNTLGFSTSPAAKSAFGNDVFADAKTSAGAPRRTCAARASEPAKEYLALLSILGKTFVSDAAASTRICAVVRRGLADAAAPAARRSTTATSAAPFLIVPPSPRSTSRPRLRERRASAPAPRSIRV